MKKGSCVLLALLILVGVPSVLPLSALAYSATDHEQPYEAIRRVVRQKGASAELDCMLYVAQTITLDVMNEYDMIEFIHNPKLSPDQSMVFIGYFLKDEPGKLRVIYLHRPTLEPVLQIKNDTIENFSEFTYQLYKTKFFYVERMEESTQAPPDSN